MKKRVKTIRRKITNTILFLFFSSVSFGQLACNRNCFMDIHILSNICRAEVSDFKKYDYKLIDYEKFLDTINTSKKVVAKFIPHKEVILFDESGNSFKLYFSKTNKYFKIDGDSFQLSKKDALIVSELFAQIY